METVSPKLEKNDILRNEIKFTCTAKFLPDFSYIISCVILISQTYKFA